MGTAPRILLAVTSDVSLALMRGFPEYLVEQGWDVHVVSAPGSRLDHLGALPGISVHPLTMNREPSPLRDIVALVRWVRLLRAVQPDVLSAGTPKAGLLGMVAGRLARTPHRVYQLRGLRLETTRGLKRWVLSATEKMASTAAHRVLSVSHSLMAKAIELGLVDESKIVVLGAGSSNGVDTRAFERSNFQESAILQLRKDLGIVEGVPVIGFVGRVTPDKGLATLDASLEILANRRIDHQLLVVGSKDGPVNFAGFSASGSERRAVIYTGSVAEPAIYYQLMDVLCLPTHREGFPNVVLEAAAASVPAVTTTATGAADSVTDGETGFLVAVGSATELSDKLGRIVLDSDLRHRLGAEARRRAHDDFERLRVWESLNAFYRARAIGTVEDFEREI